MTIKRVLPVLILLLTTTAVLADGLGDNDPKSVRPVPRVGVEVPDEDRAALEAGRPLNGERGAEHERSPREHQFGRKRQDAKEAMRSRYVEGRY